jgi:putative endonuclease
MAYFVYILRNTEGRLYIGQTSDLELRLQRHNEGKVFWTKSRGPWQLVHSETFNTRSAAMTQEKRLKALKSKKALLDYMAQR